MFLLMSVISLLFLGLLWQSVCFFAFPFFLMHGKKKEEEKRRRKEQRQTNCMRSLQNVADPTPGSMWTRRNSQCVQDIFSLSLTFSIFSLFVDFNIPFPDFSYFSFSMFLIIRSSPITAWRIDFLFLLPGNGFFFNHNYFTAAIHNKQEQTTCAIRKKLSLPEYQTHPKGRS